MGRKLRKVTIPLCISIFCTLPLSINVNAQNISKINYINSIINDDVENKEEIKENKPIIDYTKTCWNLESLFKSDKEWKKELNNFSKDIKELENYVGKITKSKTHLYFALGIKEKLDIRLNKISAYVRLKQDTNKNSYDYLNLEDNMERFIKTI